MNRGGICATKAADVVFSTCLTHVSCAHPMRLIQLMVLALWLGACQAPPPVNYPTVAPVAEADTPLGTGDVLEIMIYYSSKEVKLTYRLSPEGTINVQYIGKVDAAGKTIGQLEQEIQTRLADGYLRDPIVSVAAVEVNSRKLSVFGQVQKAGTIRFSPGMTVVDAIAQSGGFTPMAKKNGVQVTRMVDGKKVTYTVPVQLIGEGSRPNFPMAAGDVVHVPERLF
jgi:polysaccharide export outer membrane protein